MKRIHIYISGIVQGVYLRHNTMIKAKELGLNGWARNLMDGSVEIVCEGESSSLDNMVEWCKIGPRGSSIENIDIQWEDFKNEFNSFKIIY